MFVEIVVKNGRLVKLNEEELYDKANELGTELVMKAERKTGEDYLFKNWKRAF